MWGLRAQSSGLPSFPKTSDTRYKLGGGGGSPKTTLSFDNSLERLTGLTESYCTCVHESHGLLQGKDNENQPRMRCIGQSLGKFYSEASAVLKMHYSPHNGVWHYTLSIANLGNSSELSCPEFLLGLHYMDIIDWLPMWLYSVSSPLLLRGQAETMKPRGPTISHLISIKYQMWSRRPTMNNKDTSITQEIQRV